MRAEQSRVVVAIQDCNSVSPSVVGRSGDEVVDGYEEASLFRSSDEDDGRPTEERPD